MVEEVKQEITLFKTKDGVTFNNKHLAKKYEDLLNKLNRLKFYTVSYAPDLNEGRGYYKCIKVIAPDTLALKQYLFERFKDPMSLVQGCAPIPTYIESQFEGTYEDFVKHAIFEGIGDYRNKISKEETVMLNQLGKITEENVYDEIQKLLEVAVTK